MKHNLRNLKLNLIWEINTMKGIKEEDSKLEEDGYYLKNLFI